MGEELESVQLNDLLGEWTKDDVTYHWTAYCVGCTQGPFSLQVPIHCLNIKNDAVTRNGIEQYFSNFVTSGRKYFLYYATTLLSKCEKYNLD